MLEYLDADIAFLQETWVMPGDTLSLEGRRIYNKNRNEMHKSACRNSGGLAYAVKEAVLDTYELCVEDDPFEELMSLKLVNKHTEFSVYVIGAYLPQRTQYMVCTQTMSSNTSQPRSMMHMTMTSSSCLGISTPVSARNSTTSKA